LRGVSLLLFPLLLIGKLIVTPTGVKPYYYPGEEVSIGLRIISPTPSNYHISVTKGVEMNLSHPSPYIYDLNLSFFASKKPPKILIAGISGLESIDLGRYLKLKPVPTPYPLHYTGVVAEELEILDPAASRYREGEVILSFNLKSVGGRLSQFHLGIGEENLTLTSPTTGQFYAILPEKYRQLKLYYFSPATESYREVVVPINLQLEKVTTQTNIKPEQNLLGDPVNLLLLGLTGIGVLAVLIYQKWWLLLFPLITAGYFGYLNLPYRDRILKPGAQVKILPTPQSTTFYISKRPEEVQVLKEYGRYSKILVQNRVGWVKSSELEER
jgi:hypothetical protein